MTGRARLALAAAPMLSACASPAPKPDAMPPLRVQDDDATPRALAYRVCFPAPTGAPARLAIIAHGAPTHPEDTPRLEPTRCDSEPAQWFTGHGYVVVFALRRGFGRSEGVIAEDSGPCEAPDYVHAGLEGARDIDATLRWAERLPGVRADATIVVGQSTGGWAALAYASLPGARARGIVNMAGGRGGRAFGDAGSYCEPRRLVAAAGHFGATARVPTLWIYASNDSYFTPDMATAMHAAFVASGGAAALAITPGFGADGHSMFYATGGSAVWGPLVQTFLNRISSGPQPRS